MATWIQTLKLRSSYGEIRIPVYAVDANTPNTALRVRANNQVGYMNLVNLKADNASPFRVVTKNGVRAVEKSAPTYADRIIKASETWSRMNLNTANANYWNSVAVASPSLSSSTSDTYEDFVVLHSSTNDPYIEMTNIGSFDPNLYRYIDIRFKQVPNRTTGLTPGNWGMAIYWTSTGSASGGYTWTEEQVLGTGNVGGHTEDFYTVTLDMWNSPNWKLRGNITGWRFDFADIQYCSINLAWLRLRPNSYY
ncbi:hypothetical protein D3C74_50950 [compost metagenome]